MDSNGLLSSLGENHASAAALASLQDFLQQQGPGHNNNNNMMSSNVQSPFATMSPGGGDFADLLAEFTLPGSALSPDAVKSPLPSTTTYETTEAAMAGHEVPRGRERSAQAALLEQLGFPVANDRSADSGNSNGGGKDAVQTALASMDAATRAQLLSALLNLKQQATGNSPAASNPSPRPVAAVNSPRPLSHPSPRDLNHSPYQSQSSPRAFSNGGGSQHDSPQSFYGPATPHPLQQQHPVSMSAPMNNPFQPHPAALTTSLPPSLVSSPAQSPYIHAQAFYPTSQSNLPPQSLPQAQMNALSFQNAFSSPRPFDQQQQQHQQQQQQLHQQQQQQMSELQSQQLAMEMIARVGGMNPTSHDMNLRGGSATGGSYATNPDRDPSWGENEFMFSPLMSPALSNFTPASSLPPSASVHHSNNTLVSPAEFFSPLGSPAIMPQQFGNEDPIVWQQQQQLQQHSLQGLVDQTRALGFDNANFAALQAPGQPYPPSPNTFAQQNGMSPRLGPNDAGSSTAAGSGRRGAGSKKTRPSPLLKPTPDGALRRKKTIGSADVKRSSSIGSAGVRSATTSPFLGPTHAKGGSISSINGNNNGTNSSGSQKTSPTEEHQSNGSNGINTPSPVDLTMSQVMEESGQSNQQGGYAPVELMGPPPVPSSSSRRSSIQQAPSTSSSSSSTNTLPTSNGTMNGWPNLGPVTPATFMNLPHQFTDASFSTLNNNSLDGSSQQQQQQLINGTNSTPFEVAQQQQQQPIEMVPQPSPPKTNKNGKATLHKPTSSSNLASTSSSAPTPSAAAKGKGRAVAPSSNGGGTVKKPPARLGAKPSPKLNPSTKIKPLLANGLPPDALARLSSKSNYQNILEGRGVDLLGLDPSTVSAFTSTHTGTGSDNRRTSHKAAEQKRRDSLKLCFDETRRLLPPIAINPNSEDRRAGEGKVGGQRSETTFDPDNPNRGVSKVALLRRSNEYLQMLLDRIEKRDAAIEGLRNRLREFVGEEEEELPGVDLDWLDKDEKAAGTMAYYENLDDDDGDFEAKPKAAPKKAATTAAARRKSNAAEGKGAAGGARRSTRNNAQNGGGTNDWDEDVTMELDGE